MVGPEEGGLVALCLQTDSSSDLLICFLIFILIHNCMTWPDLDGMDRRQESYRFHE